MIITNSEQLQVALAWLDTVPDPSYDVETDGLNTRKNKVIGFSVTDDTRGFYLPIWYWDTVLKQLRRTNITSTQITSVLEALLKKQLATFNGSFDSTITLNDLGLDILGAIHEEVMLMVHTCDENRYNYQLKTLGAEEFGESAIEEQLALAAHLKSIGAGAKEYFKADTIILGTYAIKDGILTCKIRNKYRKELKNQKLERFFYTEEIMPLYREVTIPMERSGIRLDLDLLSKSHTEIQEDLRLVEERIQTEIAPLLPLVFEPWFLNKDYPLATYTGREPVWKKKHKTQFEAWQAENPDSYMFNLLSKHHLKKLFFDTLKELPLSRTPKGSPQVDEEFLELMSKKYTWAAELITYNKLTKLKGTYIERFLEEHEDGIFYPSFQQHRTVSGRFAGDLQQLPRPMASECLVGKYTNRIRAFFVSEPNCQLMSADYEQLEPRTFAHVSKDPALAAIFNSGSDFYSTIATMVEGCSEVSKAQRQKAKSYALGIPYGMTGYKLKFEIGVEQDEADWLVQKYLDAFPALAAWMLQSKQIARDKGQVQSELGRVRRLGRIKKIHEKYGHIIEDDLELWKALKDTPGLYDIAKKERKEYKNYLNNAINFQIQSMAASIMNRASIAVNRMLKANNLKARIVGQIHDELVLHVPNSEQQIVSKIVKDCMENTTKLSVPLRTTPQCATNYRDCK